MHMCTSIFNLNSLISFHYQFFMISIHALCPTHTTMLMLMPMIYSNAHMYNNKLTHVPKPSVHVQVSQTCIETSTNMNFYHSISIKHQWNQEYLNYNINPSLRHFIEHLVGKFQSYSSFLKISILNR